uniref:Lysine-rich nucleolar protein 1 n=1 Tax=Poecilia formosa TaxID=48698 RepID=A0A096LWB1_POEFO
DETKRKKYKMRHKSCLNQTSHTISAQAKMEGENGEAKIIKKEKKQKRGQICSPEIQICADDVSSTIETDDGDKRKKKPAGDGVIQTENFTLKAGKLEKKKRKEEKLKEKCVQIKPENMKVEKDEEMPIRSNNRKKPKKETEVSKVKLKSKKEKESKSEGNEIKAKRKKSTEDEEILPDGNVEAEEMEPQKKKRKRVKEEEGVEDGVALAAEPQSKKSKRKKNSAKDGQDVNTEAKATKEQEDSQVSQKLSDVVFLSAKPGNSDEVAINQERRKALQMEIEEASQPDKPAVLGQWSTAQFDSSQQQQKFLRLMGGFKKGFQPAGAAAGGANMALGKDAQQQLQQGLLGQFERAHARKMDFSNRGAGLGFTAPSNKKFSIDINASRSVRFDD